MRFIVFYIVYGRPPKNSWELDALVNSDNDGVEKAHNTVFRKTHALPSAIEHLLEPSTKAIHLIRHPLDVMRSALNYAVLTGEAPESDEEDIKKWQSTWLNSYAQFGGHRLWAGRPFFCGTWAANSAEWYALNRIPVLRLRYESMLKEPAETVSSICDFLQIRMSSSGVERCVASTSFEQMKKFEESEMELARSLGREVGRFSRPARLRAAERGVRFFDRGVAYSFRGVLAEEVIMKAWGQMGKEAERVGYRLGSS